MMSRNPEKFWVWTGEAWKLGARYGQIWANEFMIAETLNVVASRTFIPYNDSDDPPPTPSFTGVKLKVSFIEEIEANVSRKKEQSSVYNVIDVADALEDLDWDSVTVIRTVIEVAGYDNPYLCGYCEEFSSDSDVGYCNGCGREAWMVWSGNSSGPPRRSVGDVIRY